MDTGTSTPRTEQPTQIDHHIIVNGRCQNCLQRREIASVVIIGAGAAGIAVALSLLEKVQVGWNMDSIVMVDKGKRNEERGRGTTYSSWMNGSVCSRRDDEMSLIYNEPNHFRDWAPKQPTLRKRGNHHRNREVYGDYLQDMLRKVNMMAFDQSVDFRFIGQEAVDMDRYTDGNNTIYGVKLGDGCFVYARNVVLALGNFLKVTPSLADAPGYLSSPWPLWRLDGIPRHAPVGIIGTGTAAFEVLTRLHNRGHVGMIYMMDETAAGRFPRLERPKLPSRIYTRTHALHAAIRGLEKWEGSMASFLDELERMIREHDAMDPQAKVVMTSYADHARASWKDDVEIFARDERISVVVDTLRPIAERIWTSAAPLEREYLREHPVWKLICQETIPTNIAALYLRRFVFMGKLEVIHDGWIGNKQDHFLMGGNRRARVDYVIDASGLEYDLNKIESSSPLLQEMHRKGLVTEEPAGGIKVGVANHQVATTEDELTSGLYAIGSLTKGTHYFVEDISRITSHALRISDSIVGVPRSNPTQVALFVGRDLFSTVTMMNIVPALLAQGHMPYVFLLPPSSESVYVNHKEWLYWYFEMFVLERVLLADFKMQPDDFKERPQLALATDTIENKYGVLVQSFSEKELNDPAILATLSVHNIDIGFVIGSERKFDAPLRNAFHLFRVKPGLPPYYESTREVMQAGGKRFGYTLNRLGTQAAGAICEDSFFASKDRSIEGIPCACTAMFDSYELAVELVMGTVDRYSRAELSESMRRDFSPLPDVNRSVTLVSLTAMLDRILSQFATPESEDRITRNIKDDLKANGVQFDTVKLRAWKTVRKNTDPGNGFL